MTTDSAHPDPIARDHATALRDALDEDASTAVDGFRPAVERALSGDDPDRRARGATTACLLAAVAPGVAADLTDPLVAVATAETTVPRARRKAAHALVRLARAAPEAVAPHAEALAALVSDDDLRVAGTAAGICAALADRRSGAVAAVREDLLALLGPPDRATTVEAARALGALAETDPAAARVAADALVDLLGATDPDVAAAGARALVPLIEADPGAVGDQVAAARRLATVRDTQPERFGDGSLAGAIGALRRWSRP